MPIEIREIAIKTYVNDNVMPDTKGTSGGGSMSSDEKEKLISTCVERVIQALKDREER